MSAPGLGKLSTAAGRLAYNYIRLPYYCHRIRQIAKVPLRAQRSSLAVSRAIEPMMPPAAQTGQSPTQLLLKPVRDTNYARLLKFLFI